VQEVNAILKKDFVNDDDLVDEELINWAGLKK